MSKVFILGEKTEEEKVFTVELTTSNYMDGNHEILVEINGDTVVAIICPTNGIPDGKGDRVTIFKNSAKKLGLAVEISNI
jgi:hypothetical protein